MGEPTAQFSGFSGYLARSRKQSLDEEASVDSFFVRCFSGTTYALWRAAHGPTSTASRGLVLDAGSGRGGWRSVIEQTARRETVDRYPKPGEDVTWDADLQAMPEVPSNRYDAAVCHQVLEHIPRPAAALAELFRVVRPGGMLVISVPHLSRRHELPHDYQRFTPEGLAYLLEAQGFEIVSVKPYGGILSFMHHQFATAFLGLAAIWKPLGRVCGAVNAPLSALSAGLDEMLDRRGLLCVGVVAEARKPESTQDD